MRIGILTFHRACNFGAVLQCYALQEVLKSIGHDSVVIDYVQPHTELIYKSFSVKRLCLLFPHYRRMFRYLIDYQWRKERKKMFRKFIHQHLNLTTTCTKANIPTDLDAYVIGSDQVWGLVCLGGHEDPVYMGNFQHPVNSKVLTYAVSTNVQSLLQLGDKKLKHYAQNIDVISFREAKVGKEFRRLTGRDYRIDVDPTLLTDASIWDNLIVPQWRDKNYIVVYQVRYPQGKKYLLEKAKKLATSLECDVIDLSSKEYSPQDFVSAIKYARYILTSSFHATVFSLIFRKKFCAVKLNDGYDERYESLLKNIGGEKFLVYGEFTPTIEEVDYDLISDKLKEMRQKSMLYLKSL